MTVAEELIRHVSDTAVPDKRRILRMRELAAELGRELPDPEAARTLVQRLNNAYLVLQLAALSDDPAMTKTSRAECVSIVLAIERARGANRDLASSG